MYELTALAEILVQDLKNLPLELPAEKNGQAQETVTFAMK